MMISTFMEQESLIRMQFERHLSGRGQHRSTWTHIDVIGKGIWEMVVPLLTTNRFKANFRMHKETFDELVASLEPFIKKNDTVMRKAIPVDKRVGIALFMLKSNSDTACTSLAFGVGRSTVPAILHEVCHAISNYLYKKAVRFPKTNAEKQVCADRFFDRWFFPNTYGSVDGTHVAIRAPPLHGPDYYNYKKFFSISVLAAVDADGIFTYANVGRPGSCNDASIFNYSKLKELIQKDDVDQKFHIIGDGAFPLMECLMKPYLIHAQMPEKEKNFNKRLSRARVAVEDAFGRLKGRWRILIKQSEFDVENTINIIQSCIYLHNLCEQKKDKFMPTWNLTSKDIEYEFDIPQPENRTHSANPAKWKREQLAQQLLDDPVELLKS